MSRHFACIGLLLITLIGAFNAKAGAAPPDKLVHFIPENAIAVIQIDHPRRIVEQTLKHVQRLGLLQLDEVREVLQATPAQRLKAFLAHLEKTHNRSWQQILNDCFGQGIVLSLIPGDKPDKPKMLVCFQANDEQLLRHLIDYALDYIQEQAEQSDNAPKLKSTLFQRATIHSLGNDFHVAVLGPLCVIATNLDALKETIQKQSPPKRNSIVNHPRFPFAKRPQGESVLAWGWIDLEPLKKQAGAELDKIKLPANDIIPHLLFGGLLDAFLRSDHFWLSLSDEGFGPIFRLTSPSGREKSQEGSRLLHMRDPAKDSLLPLLNPPGTLYSGSFYWDLSALWTNRSKLFTPGALKDIEDGDKKIKPFLAGVTLGDLFNQIGARHRVVVARQRDRGYARKAKTPYPAFALVLESRNPDAFAKTIAIPIRAAGFIASAQVNMKMIQEERSGSKILSYRFEETDKNRKYDQGTLFNFTPAFARAGNVFIFSSTLELCRDLIDELNKPGEQSATITADIVHQFNWSALAEALAADKQLVATELTLRHGGASDQVEKQLAQLLRLLDQLGVLEASVSHSPQFQVELKARYK